MWQDNPHNTKDWSQLMPKLQVVADCGELLLDWSDEANVDLHCKTHSGADCQLGL